MKLIGEEDNNTSLYQSVEPYLQPDKINTDFIKQKSLQNTFQLRKPLLDNYIKNNELGTLDEEEALNFN